jgi:transposase
MLESTGALCETKRGPKPAEDKSGADRVRGEMRRLKMENDWLKKVAGVSLGASLG